MIGRFADFEWRDLIELAQQYGFEPPDIQSYYPRPGDPPFEIDAESSQGLWETISAVHHADAVPPSAPSALGKLWVKQIMGCAQIGAEQGASRSGAAETRARLFNTFVASLSPFCSLRKA